MPNIRVPRGEDGMGMRPGRHGNETGKAWERDQEGMGMRPGRHGNETRKT